MKYVLQIQEVAGKNYYSLDGMVAPDLVLIDGDSYTFSVPVDHPLGVSAVADGRVDGELDEDSSYEGFTETSEGNYELVVTDVDTLYYFCKLHPGMGGTLMVVENTLGSSKSSDISYANNPNLDSRRQNLDVDKVPAKYDGIDFTPPKTAQSNAARALEVRSEKPASQRGMTSVGIARARDLKNGKTLSPKTVRRMLSYFQRHEGDKKGSTWKEQGKGWQAWMGWGGDAGYAWARKVVRQMDSRDDDVKSKNNLYRDINRVDDK